MLLKSYEGNIKQISSGSTNHNKILVIFSGLEYWPNFFQVSYIPRSSLPSV